MIKKNLSLRLEIPIYSMVYNPKCKIEIMILYVLIQFKTQDQKWFNPQDRDCS